MLKQIYEGPDKGLYNLARFQNFIEEEGGNKVLSTLGYYPHYSIYHMDETTLRIKCGLPGNKNSVEITLFGSEEAINKIEKIILEEAKKNK